MSASARALPIALASVVLLAASPTPAPTPAASAAPPRTVFLEVHGEDREAEAFVSRLLMEAEERGRAIVDGRLSGARLSDLVDTDSEAGRRLRETFPGDSYLAAEVGPCETIVKTIRVPKGKVVDPITQEIRYEEQEVTTRDAVCSVGLTEVGADGKTRRTASLKGRIALGENGPDEDSTAEAARDAASQAARKLFGKKKG